MYDLPGRALCCRAHLADVQGASRADAATLAAASCCERPLAVCGDAGTARPHLCRDPAGLPLQGSDAQATLRAVAALGLDETINGAVPASPSVAQIQKSLLEVQQQTQSGVAVVPAILRVNFT